MNLSQSKRVSSSGLFFSLAFTLNTAAAFASPAGTLAVVTGEVKINDKPSKVNDTLSSEDTVATGAGSSAKVLFSDESVMDLGPNSALKVSDYALNEGENRTGTFSLLYGKLRSVVTKKVGPQGNVQIRTKDAVMGVRGTEFVVESPQGNTSASTVLVMSGSVEVRPPQGGEPILVEAGQMMAAQSSGSSSPAQVTQVSAEKMQEVSQSSKAEDSTFVSAMQIDSSGGSAAGGMGMKAVGGMLGESMQMVNSSASVGDMKFIPSVFQGPVQTLPPTTINPGNLVHLRVTIQ